MLYCEREALHTAEFHVASLQILVLPQMPEDWCFFEWRERDFEAGELKLLKSY